MLKKALGADVFSRDMPIEVEGVGKITKNIARTEANVAARKSWTDKASKKAQVSSGMWIVAFSTEGRGRSLTDSSSTAGTLLLPAGGRAGRVQQARSPIRALGSAEGVVSGHKVHEQAEGRAEQRHRNPEDDSGSHVPLLP